MERYNPPYNDDDSLDVKIRKTIGTTTNMNPPASRTVQAINLLVQKIEELEAEIKELKKQN